VGKIALIDVDGHNFPNLAIMKLSAFHKANNDTVQWYDMFGGKFDIVYKSKVFTYTTDYMYSINADKIIKGGSGYDYSIKLDAEIEHIMPDYSIYKKNEAYGFFTRGCPNKCGWCLVPNKEGVLCDNADIEEFWNGQKEAILLDNNVLASDFGLKQIEKCIKLGIKLDFNQGLDCRIIAKNESIAELLSNVKWSKPLRMACDTFSQIEYIEKATELLRKYKTTPSNYFIYVLVKDVQDALKRVEILRKLKLDPFAQPYIDFTGKSKVTKEQRRFARWVNHKAIFKTVPYEYYS
jgi:hypothetical protein